MASIETLSLALRELRAVVASLDESQMDTVTNCAPWTVRQLASHALNNQLLWAGMVTGELAVSPEDTMSGIPYDGDLARYAEGATTQALALWGRDGVLEQTHTTPFGELPGSTVVFFPTVDGFVHAWDLSVSVGRALEFTPDAMPMVAAVVAATCTDAAVAAGVIKPATDPPGDATDTERLMAAAGRTIPR
jgi:uncharacterized protein (TIGR03086 family)